MKAKLSQTPTLTKEKVIKGVIKENKITKSNIKKIIIKHTKKFIK